MSWVTTIYWTLDMPLTFIVGYHDGGLVEMRADLGSLCDRA